MPLAGLVLCACERSETVSMKCGLFDITAKITNKTAHLDISVSMGGHIRNMDKYYPELRDAQNLKVDLVRKDGKHEDRGGISFTGNIPGSENEIELFLAYNHTFKKFGVDGFCVGESVLSCIHDCRIYTPLPIKVRHPENVARVSAKEQARLKPCLDYLAKTAMRTLQKDGRVFKLKDNEGEWLEIDQETALSLSENWDFKKIKMYTNSSYVYNHELDACEVKAKGQEFLNKVTELKKSGQ